MRDPHNDDTPLADARSGERAPHQKADGPYVKPVLVPLGRWTLFTRQSSENEDNGFFEFDVG